MSTVRPFDVSDVAALIASRAGHAIGDYIEPLIDGKRVVVRVTERHEREVSFCGMTDTVVWYVGVDARGDRCQCGVSDDPRPADADQVARFQDSERRRA